MVHHTTSVSLKSFFGFVIELPLVRIPTRYTPRREGSKILSRPNPIISIFPKLLEQFVMDNMGPFSQNQWSGWAYNGASNPFPGYAHLPSYTTYLPESMELYSAHHRHHLAPPHMSRTTETKPRLSKDEVELLETEFQKNHKPNSSTKKALAESMRVDNARINVFTLNLELQAWLADCLTELVPEPPRAR